MGRVDGKVIVITGAAGGQGAAEASALASEGARRRRDRRAGSASPPPDGVTFRRLDVGSEEEWAALATTCASGTVWCTGSSTTPASRGAIGSWT